jgi:hypothetical protein
LAVRSCDFPEVLDTFPMLVNPSGISIPVQG